MGLPRLRPRPHRLAPDQFGVGLPQPEWGGLAHTLGDLQLLGAPSLLPKALRVAVVLVDLLGQLGMRDADLVLL